MKLSDWSIHGHSRLHLIKDHYVSNIELCISPTNMCVHDQFHLHLSVRLKKNKFRSVCRSMVARHQSHYSSTPFLSLPLWEQNIKYRLNVNMQLGEKHFQQRSLRKHIYIQVRVYTAVLLPSFFSFINQNQTHSSDSVYTWHSGRVSTRFTEGGSFFLFSIPSKFFATAHIPNNISK